MRWHLICRGWVKFRPSPAWQSPCCWTPAFLPGPQLAPVKYFSWQKNFRSGQGRKLGIPPPRASLNCSLSYFCCPWNKIIGVMSEWMEIDQIQFDMQNIQFTFSCPPSSLDNIFPPFSGGQTDLFLQSQGGLTIIIFNLRNPRSIK